jgi:hypothetical protein
MILLAALIGQTAGDGPAKGPVPSEGAQTARARALAGPRASQQSVEARLIANYQLENERLRARIRTTDVAAGRNWSLTAGTSTRPDPVGGIGGLLSVPPDGARTAAGPQPSTSLEELRRENFLLKGQLRDSRSLYREAHRDYWNEYPIRYRAASGPWVWMH